MADGYATQLGIDTASPVARGFEFDSCSLKGVETHNDATGLKGTRSRFSERVTKGLFVVGGSINMRPTAADLERLLPLILGANASGSTFALAEALQAFNVAVDKVENVYVYAGCVVARATFSSSEGGDLQLAMEIVGKTETEGAAASFPSVTYDTAAKPFEHAQGTTFTLAGAARKVRSWQLTIDNHVESSFYNSLTAQRLAAQDRTVALSVTCPWDADHDDLHADTVGGAAATIALVQGSDTLTFALAKLAIPRDGVEIAGRSEMGITINGIARMDGATKELIVTL